MYPIEFNVTKQMVIDAFINKISDTELLHIWKQVGDHYDWDVKMKLASALVKEVQEDWIANNFTDDDIPDNLKPLLLIEAQKDFEKQKEEYVPNSQEVTKEAAKYVNQYGELTYQSLIYAFCEGYEYSQSIIPDNDSKAAEILREALDKLNSL